MCHARLRPHHPSRCRAIHWRDVGVERKEQLHRYGNGTAQAKLHCTRGPIEPREGDGGGKAERTRGIRARRMQDRIRAAALSARV